MDELFLVFGGVVVLFFLILWFKEFFDEKVKKKICVICLAVSLTWIILISLYFMDQFDNKIIIAILMGHTSLGIYYLLENKVNENVKIFRLPFLLTSIFLIYSILEGFGRYLKTWELLIFLWILFGFVYLFRNNSRMNKFFNKIVECCKKW